MQTKSVGAAELSETQISSTPGSCEMCQHRHVLASVSMIYVYKIKKTHVIHPVVMVRWCGNKNCDNDDTPSNHNAESLKTRLSVPHRHVEPWRSTVAITTSLNFKTYSKMPKIQLHPQVDISACGTSCVWEWGRERQTGRKQNGWELWWSPAAKRSHCFTERKKDRHSSLHRKLVLFCFFQWTLDVWIWEVKHIDNNVILLREHVGIDSKDRQFFGVWESGSECIHREYSLRNLKDEFYNPPTSSPPHTNTFTVSGSMT